MKYDRNTIIDTLEHCTRLDGDNFPHPNCIECPVWDDCNKCKGNIPYEMKEPLLALLKEQQPKWIPVEERLPEENEDVLVWDNGKYRDIAYRDEGRWYDEIHNILRHITHWMPLPEPPKDGDLDA